jgi:hypothetical protein
MAVTLTPYLDAVSKASDPKAEILKWVGDVSQERLLNDRVMVATYVRPEKIGSLYLPDSETVENRFQGVVGLLLAVGPNAFRFDGSYRLVDPEEGETIEGYEARRSSLMPQIGDWVVYRPADGFEVAFRRASCRIFRSESIKMIASDPLYYY